MKVKVKKLNEEAKMPFKSEDSKNDFCYDLYATTDAQQVYDKQGNIIPKVVKYGTGLAFEIVRDGSLDDYILDLDARPRSSVYKTGLSLCNCTGTIDESYRGEVNVFFYNIVEELPNYKKGDRICQIKLGITKPLEFEFVDELSETKRGEGGFGHTGGF